MSARIAADAVVLLHLAFILFVLFGAFLALRWRWVVALHLPAVTWGVVVEFTGWICPLTPLENHFRALGAGSGYSGSFVDHYLMPVIYPSGLTGRTQVFLGFFVLILNVAVYLYLLYRRGAFRRGPQN